MSLSNRCFWFTEENICETGVVKKSARSRQPRRNLAARTTPPSYTHNTRCAGGGPIYTRGRGPGVLFRKRLHRWLRKASVKRQLCLEHTHTEKKHTLTLTRKLRQWTRKQGDTCLLIRGSVTKVRRIKASLTFDNNQRSKKLWFKAIFNIRAQVASQCSFHLLCITSGTNFNHWQQLWKEKQTR